MGKNKKKANGNKKKSIYDRTCERCGNEVFLKKRVFTCPFCYYLNGITDKK